MHSLTRSFSLARASEQSDPISAASNYEHRRSVPFSLGPYRHYPSAIGPLLSARDATREESGGISSASLRFVFVPAAL
jgi:hypothetical protein